jgi:predicted metal-binding membrane protein
MSGMSMPPQEWYLGLPGYLRMWLAMMVPMMLPSLVPMVSRYRRSVPVGGLHRHGLTVLVGLAYFAVWAGLGVLAYGATAGIVAVEMGWGPTGRWQPGAAGVVLLAAGATQLTGWKARQLARWREGPGAECHLAASAPSAFRHGLGLGISCCRSCGPLMLALLVAGMIEPLPMAAVTLAITTERLVPTPTRVVRLVGLAILVTGVVTMARG